MNRRRRSGRSAVAGHVQTENFRSRQHAVEHGGIAEARPQSVSRPDRANQETPERKHGLIVSDPAQQETNCA